VHGCGNERRDRQAAYVPELVAALKRGVGMLTAPDSIHLAMAILYLVDEFDTFDADGSGKTLGPLPLSGDVGGHTLNICKPKAGNPQPNLRKGWWSRPTIS
jgi:hypothetical protein